MRFAASRGMGSSHAGVVSGPAAWPWGLRSGLRPDQMKLPMWWSYLSSSITGSWSGPLPRAVDALAGQGDGRVQNKEIRISRHTRR
jgi:hypothetical protein